MSYLFKAVEKERRNFFNSGIRLFGEILPDEEGRKFYFNNPRLVSIPKECSLRRQMHTIALWLHPKCDTSFEEVKKVIDGERA